MRGAGNDDALGLPVGGVGTGGAAAGGIHAAGAWAREGPAQPLTLALVWRLAYGVNTPWRKTIPTPKIHACLQAATRQRTSWPAQSWKGAPPCHTTWPRTTQDIK